MFWKHVYAIQKDKRLPVIFKYYNPSITQDVLISDNKGYYLFKDGDIAKATSYVFNRITFELEVPKTKICRQSILL